jgi:membrane protease YdiL (CAAX protease family)
MAKYMANRIPGLRLDWGNHIQNWLIRVFLPAVIVLNQGNTIEVLGFRLPQITMEIFIFLILLTVALFLLTVIVVWFAISIAKDVKVIRNIKSWPKKPSWRESLVGSFLWTFPEECFLRGYLISQLARFDVISALFISAFFTAVLHESRGKFWVILSIFTGLFFGLAFVWTDSLLPPFIIHAVCNHLFPFILASWATALIQRAP